MKTEPDVDISEAVDIDKPLLCEVVWVMSASGHRKPCGHPATHTGTAHAELEGHVDSAIVICTRCVQMAVLDLYCNKCDVPLLKNVRPL